MKLARLGTASAVAGVMAVVLLVTGGGVAWAFWTASATTAGRIASPRVSVTQADFSTLESTYTNADARRTVTGSFTVTNTGATDGVATITITSAEDAAAHLPLRSWTVPSPADCTAAAETPGTSATGTWASATVDETALPHGESRVYCVRTSIPLAQRDALASPTGTTTVVGVLGVSLGATGTGWTATTERAEAAQTTVAIYPLSAELAPTDASRWHVIRSASGPTACLDVSGEGPAGADVISWPCATTAEGHAQPNQFWQAIPVDEADGSLVTLRPRHEPSTRLAVDGTGRQYIAAATEGAPEQQWYAQRVSSTTTQLVSAVDGRCLAVPSTTSTGPVTTVDCSDPSTVVLAPERVPLGFAADGADVTLSVGATTVASPLALQRWDGTAWVMVETQSAPGALGFSADSLEEGANSLRIVFPDGTVAYRLVVNWSGSVATAESGTA